MVRGYSIWLLIGVYLWLASRTMNTGLFGNHWYGSASWYLTESKAFSEVTLYFSKKSLRSAGHCNYFSNVLRCTEKRFFLSPDTIMTVYGSVRPLYLGTCKFNNIVPRPTLPNIMSQGNKTGHRTPVSPFFRPCASFLELFRVVIWRMDLFRDFQQQ